ncbi:hypothetical protein [Paremcibacter congregatus]|nr:hypothetical protein [Paremcibacter congregatus]QDE27533.1 hypothetical protein FIV45_09700 [Paremcibacter congregatus]
MGLIAILSSPSSFTETGAMDKIRAVIAQGSGIFHYEVEKHKDISEALTRFKQAHVDAIVILGDRALSSATFEHIVENERFKDMDIPLAVLPAGDNNIVAENLGAAHSEPHRALEDILHRHQTGRLLNGVVGSSLLKVEGVRGVGYLYGLFLCAGEITKQRHIFHRAVSGRGVIQKFRTWWDILRLILSAYGGAGGKADLRNAIRINRNQRGAVVGHFFMLLITTLEKSLLGVALKQNIKPGAAHFVSVENTKNAVIQTAKQMLRGKYERAEVAGHVATDIQHARIVLQTPFVLDGSYYEVDDSGELFVTVTDHLKLVRLD